MQNPPDPTIHSFVIRLWQEETAETPGVIKWRGYITHIPGGKQHYLKNLQDISPFIQSYLGAKGIPFEIG